MDNRNVIIMPLITEKSTHQQQTRNAYAFQVHPGANKPQIKKAVEQLYVVKVVEVRTMPRKGKPRRSRHKMSKTSDWKRAVEVLEEHSRIELLRRKQVLGTVYWLLVAGCRSGRHGK